MDGVLVDSMSYHAQAWMQFSREMGSTVTLSDIYEIEGANHRLGMQWLFHRAGRDYEPHMYEMILQAPVHRVSSPAVAEMEKILENMYRNINIGMINEMAIFEFHAYTKMGLRI